MPAAFIVVRLFKEIEMALSDFAGKNWKEALVCDPLKSRTEICCTVVRGLFAEVRRDSKSAPTWFYRGKINGKTTTRRLGDVDELDISQARHRALVLRAEWAATAAAAKDQQSVEAKAPMGTMTLDVFMRDHYMPHAFLHKRSAKKDEQLFRLHIGPRFGTLPLDKISRREVALFHNDLRAKGQSSASADHSLKLLRRALNLAVQWEFLEKNPLVGIALFNEANGVENYLDDAAVQRLVAVLRTDRNRTVSLLLMFLLSCGARKGSAMQAKWCEIERDNRVWKIPAVNSKSKRSASVSLNDSAMWVLDQLDTRGKSEYLFVNKRTGKPFTSIRTVWRRISKEAKLNDTGNGGNNVRVHDLRHTFASMLVSAGRSLYQVQQILGHSDPKITMRYAHLSAKTLQEAANAASVLVPQLPAKAA